MEKTPEVANFFKAINFNKPEWIPGFVSLLPATWLKYGKLLEKIVLVHPRLFPHYHQGDYLRMQIPRNYQKGRWVDVWGVTWEGLQEGLANAPVESLAPLQDWSKLDSYQVPDPLEFDWTGERINWVEREKQLRQAKSQGKIVAGGLPHGAMYMRLYYLRGFTNLMLDIADNQSQLQKLISLVCDYNRKLVDKWLSLGVEMMFFGDDLGLQKSLPISPENWRRYLKPAFFQLFQPCRQQGVLVSLHTDGYILDIIPDLVECGVCLLNPQYRPNTLEGIKRYCQGVVAVNLDLDRQLFPFASPQEIRQHVHHAFKNLYLPEGGLMLTAECAPDVPLANIAAICDALEELGCLAV